MTGNVACDFLVFSWCELANPVVLSTTCRRPGHAVRYYSILTASDWEPPNIYIDSISASDATTDE